MNDLPKPRVLIVDDTESVVYVLSETLRDVYEVLVATDGKSALEIVRSVRPDLILLDVMMPEMDGYEVCRQLKADQKTSDIPVIFVTAMGEVGDETKGFELGAVDYITKPASPPIVLSRVKTHLSLYDQNRVLEEKVRKRTKELVEANVRLERSHFRTVELSFDLLNLHNDFLGSHCKRVAMYANLISRKLEFDDKGRRDLVTAALLHDIGLAGFPSKELIYIYSGESKSSDLLDQYNQHPLNSAKLFSSLEGFSRIAKIIAAHHEHMDGSGFPIGLTEDDIPLESRIIAVADRYDHIRKLERKECSVDEAFSIMTGAESGKYDIHTLGVFKEALAKGDPFSETVEIDVSKVRVGMTLAKPLINNEGVHLLSTGTRLEKNHIETIQLNTGKGRLKESISIYRAKE